MQQSSLFPNHTLLFYIAKSTLMIQKGQCFVYHFSEDNQKGYFFTGIIDKGEYVMCEMVPPHKMTMDSFCNMSEEYFTENINNGKIELI